MKKILIVLMMFTMISCGTYNLTQVQIEHRNDIDYQLDKLYLEYSYKRDSLIIEFYKE